MSRTYRKYPPNLTNDLKQQLNKDYIRYEHMGKSKRIKLTDEEKQLVLKSYHESYLKNGDHWAYKGRDENSIYFYVFNYRIERYKPSFEELQSDQQKWVSSLSRDGSKYRRIRAPRKHNNVLTRPIKRQIEHYVLKHQELHDSHINSKKPNKRIYWD